MSGDANSSKVDTTVLFSFLHIDVVVFFFNSVLFNSPTFQFMIGVCVQLSLMSTLQVNVTTDPTVAVTSSGCSVMLNLRLLPEQINITQPVNTISKIITYTFSYDTQQYQDTRY